jgi:uncharacterized protein
MNFSSFETVIATFRRCVNVSQLALGRIAAVESDSFVERLFGQTTRVEWDAAKAASNRDKHGIDFDEAIEIFYGPSLLRRSDRNAEARWLAIGETEGRVITVVFTRRGDALRIISARRARKNEERAYYQQKVGRAKKGQD